MNLQSRGFDMLVRPSEDIFYPSSFQFHTGLRLRSIVSTEPASDHRLNNYEAIGELIDLNIMDSTDTDFSREMLNFTLCKNNNK